MSLQIGHHTVTVGSERQKMPSASVKLTKRAVDDALPKAKRYEIWDGEIRGLGLRVEASGTKTYILRYRPRNIGPGAPKRFISLGRHGAITPDEARTRARAALGAGAEVHSPRSRQCLWRNIQTAASRHGHS